MARKLKFTNIWIDKLKAPAVREDFSDLNCQGLNLRATPRGVKTFSFTFRLGGKTGRYTLGKYPAISLKEARSEAARLRSDVEHGIDPRLSKLASRDMRERTVERMVSEFIETYAKPRNKSWKQAEDNLRHYLVPSLGPYAVGDVRRGDLHLLLDGIAAQGKGATCNRTLAHVRKFFGWLVERGYIEHSPADHIKPKFREVSRERVLLNDEIAAIWTAAGQLSPTYSAFIKLLFLCGQRKTETARIRASQIRDGIWSLSSADTKNKRSNPVPLSRQSEAVIVGLRRDDHDFLLTSGRIGDRPINGFSKIKASLDVHCGIDDWTLHDIRRTVGTGLAQLGFDRFVIKRVLNHSDGSVTAIYDRYSYVEECRKALQAWADRIDSLV